MTIATIVTNAPTFTTADGKVHKTLAEAQSHQFLVENASRIDTFLDASGSYPKAAAGTKGGATRGVARKAIAAFLAYEASGVVAEAETEVDEHNEVAE